MGSSTDPSGTTSPTFSQTDAPAGDPPQRGFFGRLIGVFSSNDQTAQDAKPAQTQTTAPQAAPSLGMSNLRRLRVDDVAIPKVEVVAVPLDITKDALVEVFRTHGFSRVPVYKGTLDHPQGVVLL
jgi:magnesium and cobalt transporter